MRLSLKVDYNNMMADFIGEKGITDKEIVDNVNLARKAHRFVEENRGKGWLGWTELPYNQDEIVESIMKTAEMVRDKYENFVVLGIGGSALGARAVVNALTHIHHNLLDKEARKAPRFFVEDNVDPERMTALLDVIDPEKTMFNVITKSGSTSETMSQYLIIYDLLKNRLGLNVSEHIIATTDAEKGNLIKIAKKEGLITYIVPDGVGGRFSCLTPVGLLPYAVMGIDIRKLLDGAMTVCEVTKNENMYENPSLILALLQYISIQKGKNISVMMPYSDALSSIADWYCQLWGESLGKAVDNDGKVVNAGQTPVKAVGVTDQHSQVQLYTEGPYDKVITLIGVEKFRSTVEIPEGLSDMPNVHFLCGHTMNELITKERLATEYALTKAGRANHTITLYEVNEFTIGELLQLFEFETAYLGSMLNIDTYNQPGVEEGKNATYALFGRVGYEEKAEELRSAKQKEDKYII